MINREEMYQLVDYIFNFDNYDEIVYNLETSYLDQVAKDAQEWADDNLASDANIWESLDLENFIRNELKRLSQ